MKVTLQADIIIPRMEKAKRVLDDIVEDIPTAELSNPDNEVAIKLIDASSLILATLGYVKGQIGLMEKDDDIFRKGVKL